MKKDTSGPGMFMSFMRIGTFTLGGGLAMLPLIEREFVDKKSWITRDEMPELLAVAQSLPGVIAINASLLVGYRLKGIPGALWAAAGMIIPSFLIILLVALFLGDLRMYEPVARVFAGVRACMAGLLLASAIRMGTKVLRDLRSVVIFICAFFALGFLDLDFMIVLAGAACAGLVAMGLSQPGVRGAGCRKNDKPSHRNDS